MSNAEIRILSHSHRTDFIWRSIRRTQDIPELEYLLTVIFSAVYIEDVEGIAVIIVRTLSLLLVVSLTRIFISAGIDFEFILLIFG